MTAIVTEEADRELIEKYLAGEIEAFERFYRRTGPGLFAYGRSLARSQSDAEDAYQEAWLGFIRRLQSGGRLKNPAGYLYRAVRNRVIDALRASARAERASAEVEIPAILDPAESAASLEEVAELERAISRLPAEQREVVLMRAFSGLSTGQIAEVVGAPEKTVESRWRLGVEKLRGGRRLEME